MNARHSVVNVAIVWGPIGRVTIASPTETSSKRRPRSPARARIHVDR